MITNTYNKSMYVKENRRDPIFISLNIFYCSNSSNRIGLQVLTALVTALRLQCSIQTTNSSTNFCGNQVIRPTRFGPFGKMYYTDGVPSFKSRMIHRQTWFDFVVFTEDIGVIRGLPTDCDH